MLILVSPRATPPADRAFEPPRPTGSFLADLLERLPVAFDQERRELTEAQGSLAQSRSQWDAERRSQQDSWEKEHRSQRESWETERRVQQETLDRERHEARLLDGQPATPDGIAARLNAISRQLQGMESTLKAPVPLMPARSAPVPAQSRDDASGPRWHERRAIEAPSKSGGAGEKAAWFAGGALLATLLALIAWYILRPADQPYREDRATYDEMSPPSSLAPTSSPERR